MIEKIVFDYLSDNASVPVFMEVPPNPPNRYIVIQKTGSSESNRIRTATFALQSNAETLFEAATLNEEVIRLMKTASIENIFRVELNSDYEFTNTNTKKRRYQAVFNITYKE